MRRISPSINLERLSVVLAITMLAFSLTRFVPASTTWWQIRIFGSTFDFVFDLSTILSGVTALMAAVGSDWIVSDRKTNEGKTNFLITYQHVIIPVFFALVISITLNQSLENQYWWVVFGLGSLLFGLILAAEFIVQVSDDLRYSIAALSLIAISFALFMILCVALRTFATRLYLEILFLGIGTWLVSSRMISLRLNNKYLPQWIAILVLVLIQIAAGLHYIRMNPLQFGLLVTGFLYGMLSIVSGLAENKKKLGLIMEPISMMVLIGILFFLVS